MGNRAEKATPRPTSMRPDFLAGTMQASPVLVSAGLYGLLLGALASQAGLSPLEVILMSGLVFAGASQYVAIELWSTPVAIGTVAVATLLVNLRLTLMGAALAPGLRGVSAPRAYGALFFLVDEAWALSLKRMAEGRFTLAFYGGLCAPLYLAWVAATGAGAALGRLVATPERFGLDVVFAAVFVFLLTGLWRGRRDLLPWAVSAAVAVACQTLVPGPWYIFAGSAAGVAAAMIAWRPGGEP